MTHQMLASGKMAHLVSQSFDDATAVASTFRFFLNFGDAITYMYVQITR